MVRLIAIAASVLLSACATTSAGVSSGQNFALAAGERAELPDASALRYIGIANDSRCPVEVQCIRAGDADVLLDWTPGRTDGTAANGAAKRITLNTERTTSAELGRWRLQLVELAPGATPRATFRVDAVGGTP